MTVSYELPTRAATQASTATLEDRFEVIKEVGDGSFGSVAVARVRTAGAHVARRNTLVAIKTMKKTFDSLAPCLELREVIFLRALPPHPHLVPALDIFLDPLTRKLHICMEYMDGNLYQLLTKARDHKSLDGKHVKSILYQILSGLDHIHAHQFFHRDIKPENILVSTSCSNDSAFSRYSTLMTPPSTPPTYTVKIADFGLARETHSKSPYTTYVSTRWYRAPEVLLRASEYSAPVDMWAVGAMAVEIATLKPLFPGGNEVDQVWRICEIMGSPGNWYNKSGAKIGGGEWRDGSRLAQKLGFTFPKMAPHSMESILQPPQWPPAFSSFVTWCLMWDPQNRPTSTQALKHEYFSDAVDPLRPKSSTARLLCRKQSDKSFRTPSRERVDSPTLSSKPSWFRRSFIGRSESPAPVVEIEQPARPPVVSYNTVPVVQNKTKTTINKRATWANGAPIPILPSIRPVSPLSNAVTAQANSTLAHNAEAASMSNADASKSIKKIGRQLSVNSHGNHYADIHRQEAERALNGTGSTTKEKEGFFSHLRKRARRLSGRNQLSIPSDDIEANAGCIPWSNRSSLALDASAVGEPFKQHSDLSEIDKALQNVKYSQDPPVRSNVPVQVPSPADSNGNAKRQSMPPGSVRSTMENPAMTNAASGSFSGRTRRTLQITSHPIHRYETPEEEDELLDEALHSANQAAKHLAKTYSSNQVGQDYSRALPSPYPTPSPSAKCENGYFGSQFATPFKSDKPISNRQWPTPPYEEDEWIQPTSTSICPN